MILSERVLTLNNEPFFHRQKIAVRITALVLFILTGLTYSILWILYQNDRLPATVSLIYGAAKESFGYRGGELFILIFLIMIASPALIYYGVFFVLRDFILKKGPFEEI